MGVLGLALVLVAGLAGPLLSAGTRLRAPVVVGEIAVGLLVGRTGLGWVKADQPVLAFLAAAGFALVMLEAGSHVPLDDPRLWRAAGRGALLAAAVAVLAVPLGFGVARLAGVAHGPLYAVLMASSSAAVAMPMLGGVRIDSPATIALVAQVAIADAACVVALPLAENPARSGRAALGAVAVILAGTVVWALTRWLRAIGVLERVHRLSKRGRFGLELRLHLIVLFCLAGLAQAIGVSVMLAGFVAGLALRLEGEPRRLARQLFALTDGFLGPVFFVCLGASLDLRALVGQPRMIALAALLALGAVAAHAVVRLLGQPWPHAALAAGQLGVPVAAVAIGLAGRLLSPGEGSAILAAAMVTVAVTALAATRVAAPADERVAGAAPSRPDEPVPDQPPS